MSPEVLRGDNQSYEVDIWALGILLFELFHDNTPFKGKTPRELLNNILEKKPKVAAAVPKDAKDLIMRLLVVEPHKRITLEEIKEHPFVLRYPCELNDTMPAEEPKKDALAEKETEISDKGTKIDREASSVLTQTTSTLNHSINNLGNSSGLGVSKEATQSNTARDKQNPDKLAQPKQVKESQDHSAKPDPKPLAGNPESKK